MTRSQNVLFSSKNFQFELSYNPRQHFNLFKTLKKGFSRQGKKVVMKGFITLAEH